MIAMIFIGVILNHLGMLKGWCLFWYIIGMLCNVSIKFNVK